MRIIIESADHMVEGITSWNIITETILCGNINVHSFQAEITSPPDVDVTFGRRSKITLINGVNLFEAEHVSPLNCTEPLRMFLKI